MTSKFYNKNVIANNLIFHLNSVFFSSLVKTSADIQTTSADIVVPYLYEGTLIRKRYLVNKLNCSIVFS